MKEGTAMRKFSLFVLIIALFNSSTLPMNAYAEIDKSFDSVRVIVELDDSSIVELLAPSQSTTSSLSDKEMDILMKEVETEQHNVMEEIESEVKDAEIEESFSVVLNGLSVTVPTHQLDDLKNLEGVKNVYLSSVVERPESSPKLISSKELISIPPVTSASTEGEGVVVAVVDTGIDFTHKDFVLSNPWNAKLSQVLVNQSIQGGNVSSGKYFTPKVPYGFNYMDKNTEVRDLAPDGTMHGMHVAGIIGANGREGYGGIQGVAPEVQLLAMKVFSNQANSNYTYSDIYIKAMDDAVRLGADVINLSIGDTAGFSATNSPEMKAIERARQNGAVVTISAGNASLYGEGNMNILATNPDYGMLSSPAIAENSLAVASFENSKINTQINTEAGRMSSFSSWGLGANLDLKPEITAPGGGIVSTINDNRYAIMSGTSMAAPHVAGAAAILVSKANSMSLLGSERTKFIENLLMNTAQPIKNASNIPESPRRQGAGLINVSNAFQSQVTMVEETGGKGKLNLREMKGKTITKYFLITNHGSQTHQFTLATGFQTDSIRNVNGQNIAVPTEPMKLTEQQVAVVSEKQFKVGPSESIKIPIIIEIRDISNLKELYPNGFYLDGFIKVTSQTHVPLSVPLSGFVGSWNQPPVFDQEHFKSSSVWKKQGLKNSNGDMVHPENYILSPNNDGLFERVSPVYSLLRNAKKMEFEIVDESRKRVVLLNSLSNVTKHYHSSNSYTDWSNAAWDGKRQGVPVPDGKYYYQMKALIDYSAAEWQIREYPLIVDTTAPISKLEYNFEKRLLQIVTIEKGVGVAEYSVYRNGQFLTSQISLDELSLAAKVGDTLTVETIDRAGNRSKVDLLLSEPVGGTQPSPLPELSEGIITGEEISNQLKGTGMIKISVGDEVLIEREGFEKLVEYGSEMEVKFESGSLLLNTDILEKLAVSKGRLIKLELKEVELFQKNPQVKVAFHQIDGEVETVIHHFDSKVEVQIPLTMTIKDPIKTALYLITDSIKIYQGGRIDNGILSASIFGSGTYEVLEGDVHFKDTQKHWAKLQIETLASRSIIQGKSESEFKTSAPITRAEFAVLLTRALNLSTSEYKGIFKDVPKSKSWAYRGVEAAYQAGIVNGISPTKFNPDAFITRQEIATMIMRAVRYQDESKLNGLNSQHKFADDGSISAFAKVSVKQANELGIIQGRSGNLFDPKSNATRAEAAVMLYRSLLILDEF